MQLLARGRDVLAEQARRTTSRALSPAAPTLPIDPAMAWRFRARTKFRLRSRAPRSVCSTQMAASPQPRRPTALLRKGVYGRT